MGEADPHRSHLAARPSEPGPLDRLPNADFKALGLPSAFQSC
jgi:hypothetical protein